MAGYFGSLIAAAGIAAIFTPAWAQVAVADTDTARFDIPTQALAPALEAFSVQSRQQLLYAPSIVRGKHSRAVHGQLAPQIALNQLLAGTGLTWRTNPGGVFLLTAAQGAAPSAINHSLPSPPPPPPPMGSDAPAVADAASPVLQDIVITARRRSESLQRTPVSVMAFTSDDLYKRSITRASDLQAVTPGLQIGYSAFRTNPTIALRGQRRSSIGEGAPAVLIYFDEVPLPPLGSLIPTYDVSSIQVLKGPQGTLFGRNATAGGILIYSAPPTYDLEGYVDARFGNYDDRGFEGAINLPIVDQKIAVRLAGQIGRRDGYTKNLGRGPDLDDRHDESFRVSLAVEPSDTFKNVTVYDYYNAKEAGTGTILYNLYPNATAGGGNARIPALAPFFDCGTSINCDVDLLLARQNQIGPRKFYSDTPAYVRTKLQGVVNTTSFSPSDAFTIKNIFGYRSVSLDYLFDLDGTPLRLIQSQQTTRTEQFTNELQASGKLFGDKLNWIVGGFYLDDRPMGINGQALAVLSPGTAPPAVTAMTYRHTKSEAAYGQIGYDLSSLIPGLKFNAGIRRTTDKPTLCSTATPAGQPLRTQADCATVGTSVKARFSATTWTLGLDWQLSRDVFLYVTSRRGYRAGGVNSPALGTALTSLQNYTPETITDIEAGLKANGQVARMPYRFAIDGYRGKYKGIQRNYTLPPNFDGDGNPGNDPGNGLVVNSGDAILQGVEFDGLIQPLRSLSLSVSGAYTNAYYTKLQVSPVLQAAGLIPATAIQNKFPYVPSWTYGVGAEYSPELGGVGQLLLRADLYHSDSFFLNERPAADPAVKVKGYTTANIRAGILNIQGRGIDATLFANNLFNKTYVVGSGNFAPALTFVSAIYGPPRTYGIQLRYNFGR